MKKPVLGLCLSETNAQAVFLEQHTASNVLLAVGEWKNTLFDYAGDDTPGVDDFVDQLSRFVTAHHIAAAPQVSVALDTSLVFINTIPLASTVSRSDIDEQIRWELNTHFPESPKDNFISDFHILTRPKNEEWDEVAMVSARRDLVRKLHHSLGRLKFRLNLVDIDHFGADTALRHNHTETAGKFVALLGVKPKRLDVSFIRFHDMETYEYFVIDSEEEVVRHVARIASDTPSLSSIVMYGNTSGELIARAREASKIPVEILNPVRLLNIEGSARSNDAFLSQTHKYAAAIGTALRREE